MRSLRVRAALALFLISEIPAYAEESPKSFETYTRKKEVREDIGDKSWMEESIEESIPPAVNMQFSLRGMAEQDRDQRRGQLWILSGLGSVFRTPVRSYSVLQQDPQKGWQVQDGSLDIDGERHRLRLGYQYFNLWGFMAQSQRLRVLEFDIKSSPEPWWHGGARQPDLPQSRLTGAFAQFPQQSSWQASLVLGSQPAFAISTSTLRQIEQTMVGAQSVYLSKNLNLRLAGYRLVDHLPSNLSSASGHSVYLGGATLRLPKSTLAVDYGISRALWTDRPREQDYQWRGQFGLNLDPLKLTVTRQRVGPRFISFGNPTAYQDFEGTEIAPVLRIFKPWEIHGTYLRSHNNVEMRASTPTIYSRFGSVGTSLSFGRWQGRLDSQDELQLGGPRRRQYRAGSSVMFNRTRFDADATHQLTSINGTTAGQDKFLRIGLFHSFAGGGYVGLSEQLRKNNIFIPAPSDALSFTHGINLAWYNFDEFAYWTLDANADSSKNSQDKRFHDLGSGSLALNLQLSLDQQVRLYGRANSYDFRSKRLGQWLAGLEWTAVFRIRTFRKGGRLSGTVYLDSDRNGKRDPGEPGVSGVTFVLADGREVRTDAAGSFLVEKVAPGVATLSLMEDDLPAGISAARITFPVEVDEFVIAWLGIPVYPAPAGGEAAAFFASTPAAPTPPSALQPPVSSTATIAAPAGATVGAASAPPAISTSTKAAQAAAVGALVSVTVAPAPTPPSTLPAKPQPVKRPPPVVKRTPDDEFRRDWVKYERAVEEGASLGERESILSDIVRRYSRIGSHREQAQLELMKVRRLMGP